LIDAFVHRINGPFSSFVFVQQMELVIVLCFVLPMSSLMIQASESDEPDDFDFL